MIATSMLNGIFDFITDFFSGIFAFIPQMMYFVYTCATSVLDLLQYVVRKLAGLDVYYVNGTKQEGDIVLALIKGVLGIEGSTSGAYSTLSTVFWSLIIFGVIILVMATILKLVMTHYNYDAGKSNPITIIRKSIKSLFTMAIVPIVTIFGITISNALLGVLDNISSTASSSIISDVYDNSPSDYKTIFEGGEDSAGNESYSSYDFFGFGAYNLIGGTAYTNTSTISGQLFSMGAYDANRVRKGSYTATVNGSSDQWSSFGIFASTASNPETRTEQVATMIDFAFANNLILKERRTASVKGLESAALLSSFSYLESAVWYLGTIQFKSFSKYNVGLVWYYYNLWGFNFFLAIAALSISLTLLLNIMFGLITRLIMVFALFLVYPLVISIEQLDGGNAYNSWKSEFIGYILMAYGSIIGLNLSFMVLPALQGISFFNSIVPDKIFNVIILLACLMCVKDIMAVFSQMIGAKDAQAEGAETKEEFKKNAFAAADKTVKLAIAAAKVAGVVASFGAGAAALAAQEAAKAAAKKKAKEEIKKKIKKKMEEKLKADKKKDAAQEAEQQKEQAKEQEEEQRKAQEEAEKEQAKEQEQEAKTDVEDEQDEEQGELKKENDGDSQKDSKPDYSNKQTDDSKEKNINRAAYIASKLKDSLKSHGDIGEDEKTFGEDAALAKEIQEEFKERRKAMIKLRTMHQSKEGLTQSDLDEIDEKLSEQAVDKFLQKSKLVDSMITEDDIEQEKMKTRKKFSNAVGKVKATIGDNEYIQLAKESLKVVGSFTGISTTLKKQLDDSGTSDSFKESLNEFAKAAKISADKLPKDKGRKEKEKAEERAKYVGAITSYSNAITKQMKQLATLVDEFSSYKETEKAKKPKNKPGQPKS